MPPMKPLFLASLCLAVTACSSPAKAPPPPTPQAPTKSAQRPLSADLLREYLTYLASDELEGRCAGFPGNDRATEFIAARFKEAGLLPVGDDGTYFQHFKIRRGALSTRKCAGVLRGRELP